jgi:nucleoside-diphosphate-sugar epimerase
VIIADDQHAQREYTGTTLVTGATGFIGQHVIARLLRAGVKIRACALPSDDTSELERHGVQVVHADLTAPETLPPLFAGEIDRVFHLGAICNLSTPYSDLYRVNVEGVDRITALALETGVRAFVHVSSTSVYGAYRGTPFVEETPRDPQDSYGCSKSAGEDIVWQRLDDGLPAIVLRPCTVYGPGCINGAGKVFSRPTSIRAIPGHGRVRLSNVRVEDVAAVAYFLSLREDTHPTVKEALTFAAEAFGRKPPRLHLPLSVVSAVARMQGRLARRTGRIPDLEEDAVRYLHDDYVVDNAKLKATGYLLLYPDFADSMRDVGWVHREAQRPPSWTERHGGSA